MKFEKMQQEEIKVDPPNICKGWNKEISILKGNIFIELKWKHKLCIKCVVAGMPQ